MLLAAGCKVFTNEGFISIEHLDGKAVEVNCLPYSDVCAPLNYCTGVMQTADIQLCSVHKSIISNSIGYISFPLYRTTNFLCCSLTMYSKAKNPQPFAFLNTIDSLQTTAPLLVRNMVVNDSFKKYKVYDEQYNTAILSIGECLEALYTLYSGQVVTKPSQTGYKFILQTEIKSAFLKEKISKNTALPSWKYIDSPYLREYSITSIPEIAEQLKALSHLTGFIFSDEGNLFKLYFTRLDTDRFGEFMPSQLKNIRSISKKRKFFSYRLSKFFKRDRDKDIENFNIITTIKSVDFNKNSSRVIPHRIHNYFEDTWEVALKLVPLKDRSSIYWDAPYINLPLEYFKNVQWYELYSATPKLVYVESPTGLLFLVSTLGGK